ncbi:MAG: glycine cleavage system protein GcvH [Thermoprotei archaeon]|mgnify:CR=1 FL=1|nr:MAG: glycine cleavage system protein GcvH [Thermoprotei archaeon]
MSSEPIKVLGRYTVLRDRLYTKSHEWIKVINDEALVGITDYAQQKLRNIVGVELPEVGRRYGKGESMAVVESIKSVEDVYAPVTLEVIEVNEVLEEEPDRINRDPYGDGWIARVKIVNRDELSDLLKPEDYARVVEEEERG